MTFRLQCLSDNTLDIVESLFIGPKWLFGVARGVSRAWQIVGQAFVQSASPYKGV